MKIGLDLDGTVYSHPAFFSAMVESMSGHGHQFFCISSHGINEWPDDCKRLEAMGFPFHLVDPSLMHHKRHGELAIKGEAASKCDFVFDDDVRLQQYTKTPVFAPLRG